MSDGQPSQTKSCRKCGASLPLHQTGSTRICSSCTLKVTDLRDYGRIGPYVIDSLLGEGGMGEVYLAFHEATGRPVALKLPSGNVLAQHATLRHRFMHEARVLSLLNHPGILPIYEVGENDGRPWFAMKLAERGTLADSLAESGAFSPREAALTTLKLASAVQYAHEHGILHRDLKPHNILLDESGNPMLGDFGLARDTGQQSDVSRTLTVLGTPGYTAPEIADGRSPSAAGDIFSLGAIFYHLLSGHSPFRSPNVTGILELARSGKAEPLTRKGLPVELWQICRKCLEPDPQDRYAAASELERDLQAWLEGRTISISRYRPLAKLRSLIRRKPLTTGLALLTATIVIASLSLSLVSYRRLARAGELRETVLQHLMREQRHQERVDYIRLLTETPRATNRKEALSLLSEEWQHKPGELLRTLAIHALSMGDLAASAELPGSPPLYTLPPPELALEAPATGRRVVLDKTTRKSIQIINGSGVVEVHLFLDAPITALRWNPAGDSLALACNAKNTHLWRAGEGFATLHVQDRDSATREFAWNPNGRYVACHTQDGFVHVWDLEKREDILEMRSGLPVCPQWTEDGSALTWKDKHDAVKKVALELPAGVRALKMNSSSSHREKFCTVDIDEQGSHILWTTDLGVNLWNLDRGSLRLVLPKTGGEWLGGRFTEQGLQICGWSSRMHFLKRGEFASGAPSPLNSPVHVFTGMALVADSPSPPGWLGLLFTPDNRFALTRPGKPSPQLSLKQSTPYSLAFSDDGRMAATSSFQGHEVSLWSLPEGRLLRSYSVYEAGSSLAFSPDGKTLSVAANQRTSFWSTEDGRQITYIENYAPSMMTAWSPDGKTIALMHSDGTDLRRVRDGEKLARLDSPFHGGKSHRAAIAFARHAPLLVEQYEDGSVVRWDMNVIIRQLKAAGLDWPVD